MKTIKAINWRSAGVALLVLAMASSSNAWADRGYPHRNFRGSTHFGVVIGPVWSPWYYPAPHYYPSPYYYPPYPPVIIERSPPVYVEQAAPEAPQINYWYYCNASRAYYPYVKECPSGWQRVLPQPPNQR
jgi:hypothetical protein